MSFFIISDGNTYKNLIPHRIIKSWSRWYWKNTGGMGAYSPSSLINNKLEEKL